MGVSAAPRAPGAGWELRLRRPCQELGARGGCVGAGRGPSATHRSVSPRVRCCRQPPARPWSWRVEAGVARGGRQPRVLVFQGGRPGVAPVFPCLRSRWQEAGCSADSHGEGISKAKGSFLALLREKTRCFPLALSSRNPSPRPRIAHGRSRAQPGGPPSSAHTPQGGNPAFAHLPLPLNPPHPPAASNRCPRPLVRVPWSLPQQPCAPAAAAGMLRGPPAGPAALPARLAGAALPGACFGPSQSAAAAPCSRCWRLSSS